MDINYYSLFHHVKPSGVKFVIDNIFSSLKENSPPAKLSLLYSDKNGKYDDPVVNAINIPELDYDDRFFSSKAELDSHARSLEEKISENLDLSRKCVIHCHNVNLVKNSYLGRALKFLAEDYPSVLLIMQVHDFAEDNRPDRLYLMEHCSGKRDCDFAKQVAFPVANNIIYCTINSRDKDLLETISIPKERLFMFPNNIDSDFLSSEPRTEGLLQGIEEYAESQGYHFDTSRRNIISPIKPIRRKNVLESLLVLDLLNSEKDEWQLLITLDANSKEDMMYSSMIKDYVRKNSLPVVIGFGYDMISPSKSREGGFRYNLRDAFAVSDLVLTTSRLEGFGMSYLEGWVTETPVAGRRLDFIFRDFEQNGLDLSHFYDSIMVQGKDFKDYEPREQVSLLGEADYNTLKSQDGVKRLLDFVSGDNRKVIKNNRDMILAHYSLRAYHDKLEDMIQKGFSRIYSKPDVPDLDTSYLVSFFSKDS